MIRVSVFGLGYVGCVSAAGLARAGHQVTGVDVNPDKVSLVNAGRSPVVEPGLSELISEVVGRSRLRATRSTEDAIAASDAALICVGTPSQRNGQLDVAAIERVGAEIGEAMRRRSEAFAVVLRSTALPGTTEGVLGASILRAAGPRARRRLRLAVNPEFMREGCSLRDFAQPPMTLVGSADPVAVSLLRSLYRDVDAPFIHTTVRTAEMVKYVANAFHALKVCFANEIADVCDALGADAQEVMRIFLADRKLSVSEAYLRPGFAFGGSCLPKDVRALLYGARTADVLPPLLGTILPSNEAQVRRAVEAVLATRKRRVGVVGLSFKEGTDDLRESPMVALVETLIGKGCDVRVLDGNVALARLFGANRRYLEEQIPHIASVMCRTVEELLEHAQTLVIGNLGDEAARALAAARCDHVIVDLTRGALRPAPIEPSAVETVRRQPESPAAVSLPAPEVVPAV
jgi:GDP-mannose 6-dehydrogenase